MNKNLVVRFARGWIVVVRTMLAFHCAFVVLGVPVQPLKAATSSKSLIISLAKLELGETSPQDRSIATLRLKLLIGRLTEDKHLLDETLAALSTYDASHAEASLLTVAVKGQRALLSGKLSALPILPSLEADLQEIAKRYPTLPGGSPYLALARLYDLAPSWISIGSNDKAELFYRHALSIDPGRLATRIFFADFLRRRGRLEESRDQMTGLDLQLIVQKEFSDLPELLECLNELGWNVPPLSTMLTSRSLKQYLKVM